VLDVLRALRALELLNYKGLHFVNFCGTGAQYHHYFHFGLLSFNAYFTPET
jgi:hypothetical protein